MADAPGLALVRGVVRSGAKNPIHENAAITIRVQMDIVTYLLKRQLSSAPGVIADDAREAFAHFRVTHTLCLQPHSSSGMTRVGHFSKARTAL